MSIAEFQTPTNLRDLVTSISFQVHSSSKFTRFQRMYEKDRIAFVYDCLPELAKTITFYQLEILGYFDDGYYRVAVRGPHGLGKTHLAAILTHHSVLTAIEDCKTITTASAWRQLEKYLWPEIRKVAKYINWTEVGREPYSRDEFLQSAIRLGSTVEAFAVASDDHSTIEGAHAKRLVYIFDEAKSIPRPTWDAAEGAFSNANLGLMKPKIRNNDLDIDELSDIELRNLIVTDRGLEYIENPAIEPEPMKEPSRKYYVYKGHVYSVLGKGAIFDPSIEGGLADRALGDNGGLLADRLDTRLENDVVITAAHAPQGPLDTTTSANGHPGDPSIRDNPSSSGITILPPHDVEVTIEEPPNSDPLEYEALAFAISTPGEPSGQFYDIHMRKPGYDHWKVRHVTVDEAIRAGRINAEWVEQMKLQWGVDSQTYQNRVLGEFADASEEGVIPLSWVSLAVERWYSWNRAGRPACEGKRTMGVDVARAGTDKTVLVLKDGLTVANVYPYSKLSVTSTAGNVKRYSRDRFIHIETDGGLGASVYDILKDDGVPNLRPITVNGKTLWRDKSKELGFLNVRAAMWWNMRELLDPRNGFEVRLPPLDELKMDMSTPKWEMMKESIVKLESKDEIVKRLGRSTDYGDAVCLAFWNPSSGGGVVI